MNERIDKLIEECTDRHFSDCVGGFETFDKEKFAELIVRECASIFEGVYTDQQRPERIDTRIKQHFGVKE